MGRLLPALAGPLLLAAAISPAAAAGSQRTPSVVLSPAKARGTAGAGVRVGPFGLRNATPDLYDLRVFPVLLGQSRDGGLFVRLDRAGLAAARRFIVPSLRRARFAPGVAASASGMVRSIPARHSLYGGIVFQATPIPSPGRPRSQIVNVLRLNARILLDPPAALRRVRFASAPIRAEQARHRRLALRVPVRNRGNAYVPVTGTVSVRDRRGRVVARRTLRPVEVLPNATVELRQTLTGHLRAGSYSLRASLHAPGQRFSASGFMRLVRVNEVISRGARMASFSPPLALRGHDATVEATFRNTGNVPFAPRATVLVRRAGSGGAGPVLRVLKASAERVGPGHKGRIRATLGVPASSDPLELTVRLRDGGRPLDERTASITPAAAPAFAARFSAFVTQHAVTIVSFLALLLVGFALAGVRYVRRLKSALGSATTGNP